MNKQKQQENPFLHAPTITTGSAGVVVDFIQTIVIALAIVVVIYLFIAIPNQVDGQSMEPNFYNNELLLTNKIIQYLGDTAIGENLEYNYKRGDVIIFKEPGKSDFIKRVIAKPGDTISIEEGKPVVNGKIIIEEYINEPTKGASFLAEGETKRVPEDSYFVMGDNRDNSKDSRFSDVGFVARKYIKGKVFLRYWPLNRFGIIETGKYQEVDRNPSE
ncbi:signal peptidase I [Candidatus Dojkabacteria bacterium]|nr:signal peptidase I [Candidatus Dojkabacteria bacterium]